MPFEGSQVLACLNIPEPNRTVHTATAGERLAIRREISTRNRMPMPLDDF